LNIGRRTFIAICVLALLCVVAISAHNIILGGARSVTLASAPPYAGVISQALGENSQHQLPVDNVDYTVTTQNFDNADWVVGEIIPLKQNFDQSVVVLERSNGIYRVVVNPTNALPAGALIGIPNDVANYLRSHVAIYQPTPGE